MMKIKLHSGEKINWRKRSECNERDSSVATKIIVEFVTLDDRVVLLVRQPWLPSYLYDPETDEYVYVNFLSENGEYFLRINDFVISLEENRLLDAWLTKLVE